MSLKAQNPVSLAYKAAIGTGGDWPSVFNLESKCLLIQDVIKSLVGTEISISHT